MLNTYTHKQSFPLTPPQHTNTLMNANQLCASHEWFYVLWIFIHIKFCFVLKIFCKPNGNHKNPFNIVIVYLHHIPEKSITFKQTDTYTPTATHRNFQIFLFRFKLSQQFIIECFSYYQICISYQNSNDCFSPCRFNLKFVIIVEVFMGMFWIAKALFSSTLNG